MSYSYNKKSNPGDKWKILEMCAKLLKFAIPEGGEEENVDIHTYWHKDSDSLLLTNLTHFFIFIYYTSLHVSSITVPIIRRSNCINTSSGMISLCEWLLGMPVRRELQFPPDRDTKQLLTQTNHTRWCINTIRSPDYGHCDARNM
jgi:hypothetical protein